MAKDWPAKYASSKKTSFLSADSTVDSDGKNAVHLQISDCRMASGGVSGWLWCWFVQDVLGSFG